MAQNRERRNELVYGEGEQQISLSWQGKGNKLVHYEREQEDEIKLVPGK